MVCAALRKIFKHSASSSLLHHIETRNSSDPEAAPEALTAKGTTCAYAVTKVF